MTRVYSVEQAESYFQNFPAWLRDHTDFPTEAVITLREDQVWVLHETLGSFTADTVYTAYQQAHEQWDVPVRFDLSILEAGYAYTLGMKDGKETAAEAYQDHLVRPHLFTAHDTGYAMITNTRVGEIYGIQEDFEDFYKLRAQYLAEPNNFEYAYKFAHMHPMTWVRPDTKKFRNYWAPHDDFELFPVFASESKTGKQYWVLETGEHVEPEYQHRYADYALSVFDASSPEEAYIKLAANIEETFLPDGIRKDEQ